MSRNLDLISHGNEKPKSLDKLLSRLKWNDLNTIKNVALAPYIFTFLMLLPFVYLQITMIAISS